jgi:outer membrane receptor protein involved in Fe transport
MILNKLKSGDIQQLNTSVYFKEDIAISKRVNISAGLRVDHFDFRYYDDIENNKSRNNKNVVASPKVNIAYQVSNSVQIYLSTGKGFHSNDARISAYNNAKEVLPAVYGADLGVIFKPHENLYINAALWYMKVNQELIYVGDEGIVKTGGRTRRTGIEFTIRYHPANRIFLDLDANYSYARFIDENKGENHVPLSPIFTSTGGFFYKLNNNIGGGVRYKWITNRPANQSYSVTANGYFIAESMINYSGKVYEIRLSASNIFNSKWKETQFDTGSRLMHEPFPISGIHFTPGTPLFIKASFTWYIRY